MSTSNRRLTARVRTPRHIALFSVLVAATACIVLVPFAAGAVPKNENAGQFAIRVKTAELRGNWGVVWKLMHPLQRKVIPRALLVRCMGKIQNNDPRSVRAASISKRLALVPGVRGAKVPVSTVRISIEYADHAPSQTVALRVARVAGAWYWINDAPNAKRFSRNMFCT